MKTLSTPYYQDDWVTLYHGDCLEILPHLPEKSIDLVVTDPPYGLNYNDGDLAHCREMAFGKAKTPNDPRPILGDGEEASAILKDVLQILKKKLKKGACCCCCSGGGGAKSIFPEWVLLLNEVIGFKQAVVWDKGGLGIGIHFRRNYEFVLIAQNGNPIHCWNGGHKTSNVWRINKIIPSAAQHPTVKPVELMAKIIRLFSRPNDLVIDPFLGSGTTAVAAKQLGRKCIGIELEEKWIKMAIKRLSHPILPIHQPPTEPKKNKKGTML